MTSFELCANCGRSRCKISGKKAVSHDRHNRPERALATGAYLAAYLDLKGITFKSTNLVGGESIYRHPQRKTRTRIA